MLEAEWLAAEAPQPMLEFLQGKIPERKLRLFLCACCRRLDAYRRQPAIRYLVSVSEIVADEPDRLEQLRRAVLETEFPSPDQLAADAVQGLGEILDAEQVLTYTVASAVAVQEERRNGMTVVAEANERRMQAELLREVVNPFSPVIEPEWVTSTVVALAEGINRKKAFDRLPILADALQDGGCENPAVLGHCRSGGTHVKGCWVVDLLHSRR